MSGEYISREAAIDFAKHAYYKGLNVLEYLEEVPAADVVEVVRCRECMFWDTSWEPGVGIKGGAYYCPRCHLVTLKDSFCSGACRKDGGTDE